MPKPAITDRGQGIWFRVRALTSGTSFNSLVPPCAPHRSSIGEEGCDLRSPLRTGRAATRACPVEVDLWEILIVRHYVDTTRGSKRSRCCRWWQPGAGNHVWPHRVWAVAGALWVAATLILVCGQGSGLGASGLGSSNRDDASGVVSSMDPNWGQELEEVRLVKCGPTGSGL